MEDSRFEYSWFHSWMVVLARVESLRGRMGESTRQASGRVHRDLDGLFEALLAQRFEKKQSIGNGYAVHSLKNLAKLRISR